MLIFIEKYYVMKKIVLILFALIISTLVTAQHHYLVVVNKVHTTDSAKCVCDAFTNLGASECEFSEFNKYFKIRTKNLLPRAIAADYLSALGYELGLYVEVEENPQIYKMPTPTKKDSIKNDIERFQ